MLVNNYNNNSVAIHYKTKGKSLTSVKFVCVRNGITYNSYGDEKEFDFSVL